MTPAGTRDWIATHGAPLRGSVNIPGDKSISHRAIMFAALADGVSRIDGFSDHNQACPKDGSKHSATASSPS